MRKVPGQLRDQTIWSPTTKTIMADDIVTTATDPSIRRPDRPSLEPARTMEPALPTSVEVEPGLVVEVPHFAVYVSWRYKTRSGRRQNRPHNMRTGVVSQVQVEYSKRGECNNASQKVHRSRLNIHRKSVTRTGRNGAVHCFFKFCQTA